ncbi:RNB domain-containing ribonuclease [Synechococcus sp. CS-1325]|uniref:RNB domain-containing ribonuclease n=1 Tax=Synechococcus sp. CS-1325 TaxID=2847979 RepID=UPI000DB87A05|nr:RNB domain-containing ribonuclease [Synechococcus sp. CS-1325]MCT0199687.1 RNB domain-containing ribonuclease [Synechococcus sp. CS-1325]PZV01008.1 MAG: organic colvent ABC transporter permease [Cyanobium sp.]
MKFTVADLLDQLPNAEALPLAKLEKALGLTLKPDKQLLHIALDGLSRIGLLQQDETGVQRREDDSLIEARLRCSSKGFCFALREDGGEDIYIRDHQLNHAWNGDRVLVRITREGGRRRSPEGGVQCILERATRQLLAQVEQQDDRLVAVPLDDRLLTTVDLPPEDGSFLDPARESVVEVRLDRYPVAQFPACGHVTRRLPINGGEEADLDLLLTKHGLRNPDPAPRTSLRAPTTKGRTDLTALPTLLLAGWSGVAAPILPALSIEAGEVGPRLWVHAPAVAERFSPGGSLDLWLREKSEALCFGRRWLPLLSEPLSKAAGFEQGVAAEAVSVALDFSADGQLIHYRFALTTIQADASVDATVLQALADRKPKARTVPAALKPLKDQLPMLEQLLDLAAQLRSHRLANGSIDLDLPLPALDCLGDLATPEPDESRRGWLVQWSLHHPLGLLRELVLPAGRALGEHLAALQLPGLFAVNPAADPAEVNEVAKAALALEIPLELADDGNAPAAAALAVAFAATDRSRVLQRQLSDVLPMVQLSEQPGANSLAATELGFASWCFPSLHYADLWNQHLLVVLLTDGKDRPSVRHKVRVDLASDLCHGTIDWPLLPPSQLTEIEASRSSALIQRLNNRSRFVLELQSDLVAMAQARTAEPLVGQTLTGVISGVQSYGFFVEIPPSRVEGLVHVSSLKDDWYEYRSRQNRLVGRKNRRVYLLGDQVEVEIQKVDVLRHQIDLAILLPSDQDGPGEPSEPDQGDPGDGES